MPVVLGEGKGDRVFMLIHSEGRSEGSDNLRDECTSVLQHSVLEAKGEGYERLESALKELNGLLKGFLLSSAVREVHAVVGLLESGGVLHVSHVGRAEAYLIRKGWRLRSRNIPAASRLRYSCISLPARYRSAIIS